MTGFPNLPQTRGETDDDASIHLYSRVGPARPIMKSKYDKQIMNILNQPRTRKSKPKKIDSSARLNEKFSRFVNYENQISDSESDETQVEEEPFTENKHRVSKQKEAIPIVAKEKSARKPVITNWIFGFSLGVILIIFVLSGAKKMDVPTMPSDLSVLRDRLYSVEEKVSVLNHISEALDNQVDIMESKQTDFITSIRSELESVEISLSECKGNVSLTQNQYRTLQEEMNIFRKTINGLEIITETPADLEDRISQISHKIAQLSKAGANLQEIKSDIVEDFMSKLPNYVPVYIKNNKIHYIPEFHQFLQSFVERYDSKSSQNWKSFIEESGKDFQIYLKDLVKASQVEFISKAEFEKILNERLADLNQSLNSRYMKILEHIDLNKNVSKVNLAEAGNKVVLDNLLEIIGKGSVKINYADYNLGSRILGFLTTTGNDSNRQKSFARKLFLGWYDYLGSNGLSAPKNLKLNANNILLDGGEYWQCESNWCSAGVRLSSPIILTDLILNNPPEERPKGLNIPTSISIYIKPRKKSQALKLEEYLGLTKHKSSRTHNKYLAKFHKVLEVSLNGEMSMEHIQVPLSLVNMKILVKDIFVEIESRGGFTGLYNIKAYGLSEFNAYKYSQQFESLLDKLPHTNEASGIEFWEQDRHGGYTLEDDEYI
ncbi:hypothetical protein JCM33374_g539 [Metschnikowia sp. JCM 33374]|nr:hypothetical protein JCM33374_g539 [Metschnikowia sp. JCM 33374]